MAVYTVGPMPGDSKRWRVKKDGYQISKHNAKANVKQQARDEAGPNDSITVKDRHGKFQKRIKG